jgi:hypothetical protein
MESEQAVEAAPRAWWISWYHDRGFGPFELHSPWWISGFTMDDRETIVGAVQAETEKDAWEKVYASYDARPASIEERFIEELDDREQQPSARAPWGTVENGRFQHADWMVWEVPSGG